MKPRLNTLTFIALLLSLISFGCSSTPPAIGTYRPSQTNEDINYGEFPEYNIVKRGYINVINLETASKFEISALETYRRFKEAIKNKDLVKLNTTLLFDTTDDAEAFQKAWNPNNWDFIVGELYMITGQSSRFFDIRYPDGRLQQIEMPRHFKMWLIKASQFKHLETKKPEAETKKPEAK